MVLAVTIVVVDVSCTNEKVGACHVPKKKIIMWGNICDLKSDTISSQAVYTKKKEDGKVAPTWR